MRRAWNSAAGSALRRGVGRSRLWRRCRDLVLRAGQGNFEVIREDIARRYLRGSGIEVGPMTKPLRVSPGVHVRYVDRHPREELIALEGPNLEAAGIDPAAIPHIDVVDDAARFATFADGSTDFVIANHVLEHMEDPIGALAQMLRIIRPGGVALITLPDARHWFDAGRERTTVEHLLRDHADGPAGSRHAHYEEWARLIEGLPEDSVSARVAEFAAADARHHFHVWELEGFLRLLLAVDLPCEIVHAQSYVKEFAVVLRRTGSAG